MTVKKLAILLLRYDIEALLTEVKDVDLVKSCSDASGERHRLLFISMLGQIIASGTYIIVRTLFKSVASQNRLLRDLTLIRSNEHRRHARLPRTAFTSNRR
jgi:hypothetical protein